MFHWDPDGIRFMQDASEYSNYHRELAKLLLPCFPSEAHVCDVGCGLGHLSLELARQVSKVTAVDRDARVLQVLEENCRKQGIRNVEIRCCDMELSVSEEENGSVGEERQSYEYDGMIFCFYGAIEDILRIAALQCRGTVVALKKNDVVHRFSAGEHTECHDSFGKAAEYLEQQGVPFESRTLELEFGQPFRTMADAKRFFEIYSPEEEKKLITDEFLKKKLISMGDREFPLYLPHRKRIGWLQFKAEDARRNRAFQ